jgi:uncharacterized protein
MGFTRQFNRGLLIFFSSFILLFCGCTSANTDVLRRCPEFDLPKDFDASVEAVARLYSGAHPIFLAILENNHQKLDALLKAGANPNICGPSGVSPLSLAASVSTRKFIETLISYGANLNYPVDSTGASPIFQALAEMKYEAVSVLIVNSADVKLIADNGYTTLHSLATVPQLAGLPIGQKGRLEDQQIAVANELLKRGLNVNAQNKQGFTPLMLASLFNNRKLVSFLLQKGANVKLQSARSETALSYAEKKGHKEIVDLLRKAELVGAR